MPKRNFSTQFKQSLGAQGFIETNENKVLKYLPINKICCRNENKFVDEKESSRGLLKSIKNQGLLQPIVVIKIERYKEILNEKKDEIANELNSGLSVLSESIIENKKRNIHYINETITYLTTMKEKGCEYVITSGHRRFKAFVSLALEKDMYSEDGMVSLYTEETKENINKYLEAQRNLFLDDNKNNYKDDKYKFYMIPCNIETSQASDEINIYTDSNTTQRDLTAYEIVINHIDLLDKEEKIEEIKNKIKEKVIGELNTRSLNRWITDFVKNGELEKSSLKLKNDEEKKQILFAIPFEKISKTKNYYYQEIAKIISDKSGKNVSARVVEQTYNMLGTFGKAKEIMNIDIFNYIYKGFINFRSAIELENIMKYYIVDIPNDCNSAVKEKLLKEQEEKTKKLKEKLIEPIEEERKRNTVNEIEQQKSISEISTRKIEELVKENKKQKTTKVFYTSSELIEMIYQVKDGIITIDELINKIELLKNANN